MIALFLERLKTEGEEEVIDDIFRLNYALAFMHKYIREDDIAVEYCRNIEGYLLGRYGSEHNKLRRFHDFFPEFQDEVPRENDQMDENGDDDNRDGDQEDSTNQISDR